MAKKFMHTTKGGDQIALSKLEDNHLQNIINLMQRKVKEGIVVRYGGGSSAEDIWYDEDHLYGEEALAEMHYGEYVAKQKRSLTRTEANPCQQSTQTSTGGRAFK